MNKHRPTRPRRQKGAALLFTLGALVLLTGVIVAFFQQARLNRQISYSYTQTAQADMLARTALDIVSGEIRKEALDAIAAGGIAIPTKRGVVSPDENVGAYTLLKVARFNTSIAPSGGRLLASPVTLDTPSLNNRSNSDWFTSGPQIGTDNLPSWAYMTRSNGVKVPSVEDGKNRASEDYVVGRFTYTVYNTSGMLDANVAGYPTTAPFAMPVEYTGTKSSVTYADLTEVGFSAGEVDQLVAWRNASLTSDEITDEEKIKSFDEWATGLPRTTGTPNESALAAFRSGRTQSVAGDNAFFSRADLKRFIQDKFSEGKDADTVSAFTANTMSALTHFTRTKSQPSWGPSEVVGSSVDYPGISNDSTSPNRYVPNVVVDADTTVRVYADDGTYEELLIRQGEQLMQRRFSLAKLAWLGHEGPNTDAFAASANPAEAIQECFGLSWSAAHNHWVYDNGDEHNILTLEEVKNLPASKKRLPDFFETLKLGILSGSIGQHPGAAVTDVTSSDTALQEGPLGLHYDTYSADKDRHILQIGANIIDHADRDNFPSALYLELYSQPAFTISENRFNNTVFGLENIPMLMRVGSVGSTNLPDRTASYPNAEKFAIWMQPEVWNMHHPQTTSPSPSDTEDYPTPRAIRMVTFGKVDLYNHKDASPNYSTAIDFGRDYDAPETFGIVCFVNPHHEDTAPNDFFGRPRVLEGFEQVKSAQEKYDDSTSLVGPDNRYPVGADWIGKSRKNSFMGVFLGEVMEDPVDVPQVGISLNPDPGQGLTFVLEYFDGSEWRPYSTINRIQSLHGYGGSSNSRHGKSGAGWMASNGHIDPRTDRFSGSAGRSGAGNNKGWAQANTPRESESNEVIVGDNKTGRAPIFQAWPRESAGFVHNPNGGSYLFDSWSSNLPDDDFHYIDPDGVVRPGDAWRGDLVTGDGILTYPEDQGSPMAQERRRPVILNRPFRSVGELGYVFRDLPFKSLDFWSDKSADAALLDLFSISTENSEYTTRMVNVNAAPTSVINALLAGAILNPADTSELLLSEQANQVAKAIGTRVVSSQGLRDPSQLVTELSGDIHDALNNSLPDDSEKPFLNKGYGEVVTRALGHNLSANTWNLLIDVVAQSGRLSSNADQLSNFVVEGEKRYWLHLSIDRETGDIIASQLEPSYE